MRQIFAGLCLPPLGYMRVLVTSPTCHAGRGDPGNSTLQPRDRPNLQMAQNHQKNPTQILGAGLIGPCGSLPAHEGSLTAPC